MICPNCQCEYIRGVTECADCGVPLVDALDSLAEAPPEDTKMAAIWAGDDPADCAAAKQALTRAEIPFVEQSSDAYIILRSMRPKIEIFVAAGEVEHARKVLLDLPGSTDLGQLTPEEIASLALPESEGDDPDETEADPDEPSEDWDDQENVSEIWTGEGEDLANNLAMSLRENGISAHMTVEGSRRRLVVHRKRRPAPGKSCGRSSKQARRNDPARRDELLHFLSLRYFLYFLNVLESRSLNDPRIHPHRGRARRGNHGQRHRARLCLLRL